MIAEHERAVLTSNLPGTDFKAGDVGTVVHVYSDGQAYEIEFFAFDGRTLDVVTVEAHQVRPIGRRDVMHVRELTA